VDILAFLRDIPPRYRHAWTVLAVTAVLLLSLAVVLGPEFVNVGQWLRGIPRVLYVALIGLLVAALVLTNLSASARQERARAEELVRLEARLQNRLDAIAANVELLLATMAPPRVIMQELHIPPPAPDRNIGWLGVIIDTLQKESVAELQPAALTAIFTAINESTALVTAALDGRVAIDRIILGTNEGAGNSYRPDHFAKMEFRNATSETLSLKIPKGQVFENAARHQRVQNLVVSESVTVTCPPGSSHSLVIPAYCLNKDLSAPAGLAGNITPLKVKFTFNSQDSVWMRVHEART